MKVLLISVNREKTPYPVMPIGVAFVASWLKRDGHEVTVLDLCFEKDPMAAVRARIAATQPELVGLSLRNLDNCDFVAPKSYLPDADAVLKTCRSVTDAPIVLGGSAAGIFPQAIFRRLKPDYLISGDGEMAMGGLARALEKGEDPARVPGVSFYRGEKWHAPAPLKPLEFSDNVFPRIYEWVNVLPYLKHEGSYPIQTKRGCALKCVYCTYKNIEGQSYRFNPASRVVDEIEDILQHIPGASLEFVDSTFNSPSWHALEILRELEARRVSARIVGAGLNPISAPPELFAAMRRCGFRHVVCTPESASDAILKNLKKGFSRKHIEQVAVHARAQGLQTLWIFLMGGPGENVDTVRETLDFIHEEIGSKDVAYITCGLRIYPFTELAQMALREKVIGSEEALLEPAFYFSYELEPEALDEILHDHARQDPRIVRSVNAEKPWIPAAARVLHWLGNKKPFWTYAPFFNRMLTWGRAF